MSEKPPPGVVPRCLWLQARTEELSSAIAGCVKRGYIGGGYLQTLKDWCQELLEHLEEINNRQEKETK